VAHGVSLAVLIAVILTGAFLLMCCGYCVAKGRTLRREYPLSDRPLNRGFVVVTILEAAGVAGVVIAAQKMGRFDVLPAWIGIVIGLHFLGLARALRAPVYYATGCGITLWCVLAWVLFRGNLLGLAVGVVSGAILWVTSSFNLVKVLARRTAG
jgi:hypothetical protein